jgi:carbamoyl-phosphate synthase large subunit
MTDPELADATYVEPLTAEVVERIIERERPDALLPTLGGQTGLNLAMELARTGVLERNDVEMIGADADAIEKAEHRQRFREAMQRIDIECPRGQLVASVDEALAALEQVGLPAIISSLLHLGRRRRRHCNHAHRADRDGRARPRPFARGPGPRRGVAAGLEGIRDGGGS